MYLRILERSAVKCELHVVCESTSENDKNSHYSEPLTSASLHLSSAMDMTSLLLMTESIMEVSFNRGPLRLRTFSRINSYRRKIQVSCNN